MICENLWLKANRSFFSLLKSKKHVAVQPWLCTLLSHLLQWSMKLYHMRNCATVLAHSHSLCMSICHLHQKRCILCLCLCLSPPMGWFPFKGVASWFDLDQMPSIIRFYRRLPSFSPPFLMFLGEKLPNHSFNRSDAIAR